MKCPKCGSKDINKPNPKWHYNYEQCNRCGYIFKFKNIKIFKKEVTNE